MCWLGSRRRCIHPWTIASLLALFVAGTSVPVARGGAPDVQTLRYDITSTPLFIFNLEFVADYFFPVEPAEIVKTRFHLTFNTTTSAGNFPAQDIALMLQPPVPSPVPGDPNVLTKIYTGGDFGWQGSSGTFTYNAETDDLDGVALPAPPGSDALLYALTLFNARRLIDPSDLTPMGGQFLDSWIEVDFVFIPEPTTTASAGLLVAAAVGAAGRRGRARPRPNCRK